MKKIKSGISGLIMSIIEIIIGVLLLINPVGFTSGIIIALGIAMAVTGLGQIVGYFRADAIEAAIGGQFTKGMLLITFGIFCAFRADWFIVTFPVITILYGVLILITGVSKLQKAIDLFRIKQKYWFVALISAVLTLVFAILIVANPFATTSILWTFIGVTLIIEAVVDVIAFIFEKKF